jgi:hypothetical protein
MLRWSFAFIVGLHGLIHLLGFAKAFGLAELPQLGQRITRPLGLLWLLAALLVLGSVACMVVLPRWWWAVGALACLISQAAIASSWSDAKVGTAANLLLLVGALSGYRTEGPNSFGAQFARDAAALSAARTGPRAIASGELALLPEPVQRYLRATGFASGMHTRSYRLRFRGRIRGGPEQPWMAFTALQHSFADPPARLFLMDATRGGLPVQAFHRFVDGQASFQVRLAGALDLVDARGPELTRAETVTLFNDMCLLAPGTLASPAVAWEPIDAHAARARFTLGPHSITATLQFDDAGRLVDFVSDDRLRASADGTTFTAQRFSTPVRAYRRFGAHRLMARGEARWHAPAPEGVFSYGEFELVEIAFDEGQSASAE